jgi:uncharacterized protein
MNFGLKDRVIQQFGEVFSQYPEIESVVIYGSRAKGNHREGSDIDITIMGEQVTEDIRSRVNRFRKLSDKIENILKFFNKFIFKL